MNKIYLLAGFFILTNTSQSFTKTAQQDTLPNKTTLRCNKLCDTDLRLSFFHWRKLQMRNPLVNTTGIDLRSHPYVPPDKGSAFHLNWWPQAIQLNSNRGSLPDLGLADIALELYRSRLRNN